MIAAGERVVGQALGEEKRRGVIGSRPGLRPIRLKNAAKP